MLLYNHVFFFSLNVYEVDLKAHLTSSLRATWRKILGSPHEYTNN